MHNRCVEVFDKLTQHLEQSRAATFWATEPMAKELAHSLCSDAAWQVKLVKVRMGAARSVTPQPQLHAADAPMRRAVVRIQGSFHQLDDENWSTQRSSH